MYWRDSVCCKTTALQWQATFPLSCLCFWSGTMFCLDSKCYHRRSYHPHLLCKPFYRCTIHPSLLLYRHIVTHLLPGGGCIWDKDTQDQGCVPQPHPANQMCYTHRQLQKASCRRCAIANIGWPLLLHDQRWWTGQSRSRARSSPQQT